MRVLAGTPKGHVIALPEGAIFNASPVAFSVNVGGLLEHLRTRLILDIAEVRYGPDGMRLVGLLLDMGYVLPSSTDCSALLYSSFLISLTPLTFFPSLSHPFSF